MGRIIPYIMENKNMFENTNQLRSLWDPMLTGANLRKGWMMEARTSSADPQGAYRTLVGTSPMVGDFNMF